MGIAWVLTRMHTKSVPYTFVRKGYYYFSRRVPSDLQKHYSKDRIVVGLRTKSFSQAKSRAFVASAKLDEYWSHLRMTDPDILGHHLLRVPKTEQTFNLESSVGPACLSFGDALELYIDRKGNRRSKFFFAHAKRNSSYLIDVCGDKPLDMYRRSDALRFRDELLGRNLTGTTVTRILTTVRAIFNFAVSEHALDIRNPFIGLYHDRSAGVTERKPIPIETVRLIQGECIKLDDEMRWLVAFLSDTGMRLAEGAGLLKSDIHLECDIPHVILQTHPWRPLKTSSSQRMVPLIGASLWAAKRIVMTQGKDSKFAFPRYNKSGETRANSASAGLNRWLRTYLPPQCSLHSFRHSMRDRLRAVECPSEIADQIGGWTAGSVGQGYGAGYDLVILQKWLLATVDG